MLRASSFPRVTKVSLILGLLYHWQLLVIDKLTMNLSSITEPLACSLHKPSERKPKEMALSAILIVMCIGSSMSACDEDGEKQEIVVDTRI